MIPITKEELILKQQLEIENLKREIEEYRKSCSEACHFLIYAQQWDVKAADFQKIAMINICHASNALEAILYD